MDQSIKDLPVVYHGDDHALIRAKIDRVDAATQKLAEIIMNNAVGQALKGTKIDEQTELE